jgi:hypothetical protein
MAHAFVLILTLGCGSADDPPADDVNAKMAAFAQAHLGEQVGDGICATLIREALKESGGRPRFRNADGEGVWGEPVASLKEARPGDIIQFEHVKFIGKRRVVNDQGLAARIILTTTFPDHSAIITHVGAKGKTVTILHQNALGLDGTPVKSVTQATLVMAERRNGGTIKIYRPVPIENHAPGSRPLASLGRMD